MAMLNINKISFYRFFETFFGRERLILLQRLCDSAEDEKIRKDLGESCFNYSIFRLRAYGLIKKTGRGYEPLIKVNGGVLMSEDIVDKLLAGVDQTSKDLLQVIFEYGGNDGGFKPGPIFKEISRTHILFRRYTAPKSLIGKSQTALWYTLKKLSNAGLVECKENAYTLTKFGRLICERIISSASSKAENAAIPTASIADKSLNSGPQKAALCTPGQAMHQDRAAICSSYSTSSGPMRKIQETKLVN